VSRKVFAQLSIFTLLVLAFLGTPASVWAGGVCGGTYYVEAGETIASIAQRCGTTVSAIYAANPGLNEPLYTGQAIMVLGPETNYNPPPVNSTSTYVVQPGDTFARIAGRFGVSMYDLWAANPYIWDINLIYVGQVLNIPAPTWNAPVPTWHQPAYYPRYPAPYWPPSAPTYPQPDPSWFEVSETTYPETPEHLSYGTAPGAPKGRIKLSNKANADVYISLQGTTSDGANVINEYTVDGTMNVKVPAGRYYFVAWVGGEKRTGSFNLGKGSDHTITFYKGRVVVE
jgi:LysM repeat protein